FLAMRGDRGEHGLRRFLARLQGRGRDHAPSHHARVHVPGLGLEPELDRDPVGPRLGEQRVELAERSHGKRAGRLEKDLENARTMSPLERIGAPGRLRHLISPVRQPDDQRPYFFSMFQNTVTGEATTPDTDLRVATGCTNWPSGTVTPR